MIYVVAMDLGGSDTVHIAAQGFEEERVYEPIVNNKADRAILLIHEEKVNEAVDCRETITAELDSAGIPVKTVETDFFDLYESLQAYSKIISDNCRDELFINISTGSKLTAVAGMIACMSSSAQPYYAEVEYEARKLSGTVTDTEPIHIYPIGLPDDSLLAVLEILYEMDNQPSKIELLESLEEQDHSLFDEYNRSSLESMYDPLDDLIEPLAEREFLNEVSVGGETKLCLTEEGELAYKAFRQFRQQ